MRLPIFSLCLALLLPLGSVQAQTSLPAGTSHYAILQNNKNVGSSEFTVAPTAAGYSITSQGELRLSKLSYSFTNTQNLDRALNLVNDRIIGTVNGSAVTISIQADPTGRQFNLNINAKGKDTQNTVDRHQHLALLPDLDAAGYMLLTRIGLENPQVSWALIPKESGLLVPTVYANNPDVRGRLNGREIAVQHTTVTVSAQNAISVELFHTQDGRLLEADLPQQNFFVVLDGFRLINRPKFAPPRSPEPPPQQDEEQPEMQQQ